MATITPLPTPVPSRQDPANFAERADAFLSALPTFGTETNAVAAEVNTNKNTAVSSASTATTQAGIATTAANTATTQAGIATTKAGEALTSANNAAASFDAFDDRFLGSKASNPTLDNDGNALLEGAMYWNTTSKQMRVWNGSAWVQTFLPAGAYLQAASNLSDLNNAATARSNLGLGTAALKNTGTSGDAIPLLNALNTFSQLQIASNGANYVGWSARRLDQKGPGIESQATLDVATSSGDARVLSLDATNNIIRYIRVKNTGGATVTDSAGVEREIYHQGSILGSVSQSSGIPTGAIIERGSNANGGYVRFADGTQICTAKITYLTTSTANQSVTLPATFINSDYSVSATVNQIASASNGASYVVNVTTASPTSILLKTLLHTATTINYIPTDIPVSIICVGRWF